MSHLVINFSSSAAAGGDTSGTSNLSTPASNILVTLANVLPSSSSSSSLQLVGNGDSAASQKTMMLNNNMTNLVYDDGQLVTTPATDPSSSSSTVKPDIIVGFVFLALSALLLLTIIIICLYVQRPFKRLVRYYHHLQRKRMLARMGVDEIHDLQYDAGFVKKSSKPAIRRQRLISQQFDAIFDVEANDNPHNLFYRHHQAFLAKRISSRSRGARWSQGDRNGSVIDEEPMQPSASLPVFSDDKLDAAGMSVHTTSISGGGTTDNMSTFPTTTDDHLNPHRPGSALQVRQMNAARASAAAAVAPINVSSTTSDEGDGDATGSMTSATMGVESVSKNTPQSLVLKEVIAKSRRTASISREVQHSNNHKSPDLQRQTQQQLAATRRHTVDPAITSTQVVGRFRVSEAPPHKSKSATTPIK